MVEGRAFPDIGKEAPVDGSQVVKKSSAKHIFPDRVDGRQKASEAEFGAVGVEASPVNIRGMPATEERPIQNMPQIQPLVQEMGVGVLGQE